MDAIFLPLKNISSNSYVYNYIKMDADNRERVLKEAILEGNTEQVHFLLYPSAYGRKIPVNRECVRDPDLLIDTFMAGNYGVANILLKYLTSEYKDNSHIIERLTDKIAEEGDIGCSIACIALIRSCEEYGIKPNDPIGCKVHST